MPSLLFGKAKKPSKEDELVSCTHAHYRRHRIIAVRNPDGGGGGIGIGIDIVRLPRLLDDVIVIAMPRASSSSLDVHIAARGGPSHFGWGRIAYAVALEVEVENCGFPNVPLFLQRK